MLNSVASCLLLADKENPQQPINNQLNNSQLVAVTLIYAIFKEHFPEGKKCLRCSDRPNWWAYLDLNQGPRPYQGRALTN